METEPDEETVRIISARPALKREQLETLPPLDEERIKKLANLNDEDIDVSDMPALTQEQMARFVPAKLLTLKFNRT